MIFNVFKAFYLFKWVASPASLSPFQLRTTKRRNVLGQILIHPFKAYGEICKRNLYLTLLELTYFSHPCPQFDVWIRRQGCPTTKWQSEAFTSPSTQGKNTKMIINLPILKEVSLGLSQYVSVYTFLRILNQLKLMKPGKWLVVYSLCFFFHVTRHKFQGPLPKSSEETRAFFLVLENNLTLVGKSLSFCSGDFVVFFFILARDARYI